MSNRTSSFQLRGTWWSVIVLLGFCLTSCQSTRNHESIISSFQVLWSYPEGTRNIRCVSEGAVHLSQECVSVALARMRSGGGLRPPPVGESCARWLGWSDRSSRAGMALPAHEIFAQFVDHQISATVRLED